MLLRCARWSWDVVAVARCNGAPAELSDSARVRDASAFAHYAGGTTTERTQTQIDAVYASLDEILDAATNPGVNG